MVDGPTSGRLSVSDRRDQLREHRARFHIGVCCGAHRSHCTAGPWAGNYSPVLFGSSTAYLAPPSRTGDVVIYTTSSPLREEGVETWVLPQFRARFGGTPIDVEIAAVDAAQDLLVVAQNIPDTLDLDVHLVSLKGFANELPHPRVAVPTIRLSLSSIPTSPPYSAHTRAAILLRTQVCGPYVAWNFGRDMGATMALVEHLAPYPTLLQVWNWTTGDSVWEHKSAYALSFAFLDRHHIVLGRLSQTAIRVYRFNSPESPLYSTAFPPDAITGELLKLELPPVQNVLGCYINPSSYHHASESDPFVPDPSQNVVVVHFTNLPHRTEERHSQFVLIPVSTFYRHMTDARDGTREQQQGAAPTPPGLKLAWHEWGPRGCLLWHFPDMCGSLPTAYGHVRAQVFVHPFGSRVAVAIVDGTDEDGTDNPRVQVLIYDLNPWARLHCRRHGMDDEPPALEDPKTYKHLLKSVRPQIPRVVHRGPTFIIQGMRVIVTNIAMAHKSFTIAYTGIPGRGFRTFHC